VGDLLHDDPTPAQVIAENTWAAARGDQTARLTLELEAAVTAAAARTVVQRLLREAGIKEPQVAATLILLGGG
jgi:hypothetical protein